MPSRKSLRSARRALRRTLVQRTALVGAAIGLVTVTGLTSAAPAMAATETLAAQVIAGAPEGSPADTLLDVTAQAQTTRDAARTALAEAAAVTDDVAASGLDVGAVDTSVDTDALRAHLEELSSVGVMRSLLLPDLLAETEAETRQVSAHTAELRSRLADAIAQKAADDAAAQAAAAAQQAADEAAAAAAEAQRQAEEAAAALAAANTPEGAQAVAQQMASSDYGWGDGEFSCLVSLWQKESGWDYQAYNDSSGATGIPQALPGSKMASAGSDWEANAVTQIIWGLDYIASVYGSPCSAWSHSQATDWY